MGRRNFTIEDAAALEADLPKRHPLLTRKTPPKVDRGQTKYNPELAKTILFGICEGFSLNEILDSLSENYHPDDIPTRATVNYWRTLYPDFGRAYDEAFRISASALEDEALELARALGSNPDITGTDVAAMDKIAQQIRWSAERRDHNQYGNKTPTPPGMTINISTSLDMGQPDYVPVLDNNDWNVSVPLNPAPVSLAVPKRNPKYVSENAEKSKRLTNARRAAKRAVQEPS